MMLSQRSNRKLNNVQRFIVALVWTCSLVSAVAAGAIKPLTPSQPIQIKSNELFTDTGKKTATFLGKVTARQADLTIFSDKLIVYYQPTGNDVDRVEAIGNVRIVQDDRIGTAGRALYDGREGKITLMEAPRVYQGKNFVSGNVITYFVADGKSVVDGGGSTQVEAVIHPGGKKDNVGKKP